MDEMNNDKPGPLAGIRKAALGLWAAIIAALAALVEVAVNYATDGGNGIIAWLEAML